MSLAARFWAKVVKTDGCWRWLGYTVDRYGRIALDGGRGAPCAGAHRVSWELHNGPIPEGMCVLHRCDNPPCVNPDHLFLGTQLDNIADRVRKGRNGDLSGQNNGRAKLTSEQVLEMRSRHRGGESYRVLGIAFGVSWGHVGHIVKGDNWPGAGAAV